MENDVVYLPVGNAAPDFTAETKQGYNYTSSIIAVDIHTGKILWHTPFIAKGNPFNITVDIPDTHDWGTTFGTNQATISTASGTQNIIIAHDKRGNIAGLNSHLLESPCGPGT